MMKVHKKKNRVLYYTNRGCKKRESVADVLLKDGRKKMSETLNVREAKALKD